MGKKNSKPGMNQLEDANKALQKTPILKTMNFSKRVDQMLKLQDIRSLTLQFVFQKNNNALQIELDRIKVSEEIKTYEHELTLVFWFAIHLENLQIASALMNREFLIKQLVACALMNSNVRKDEDNESDEGDDWEVASKGSQESFKSANLSDEEVKREGKKKKKHDVQKEGGSSEGDSFYDEDDYGEEEDNHQSQQINNPPEEKQAQNKSAEKGPSDGKSLGVILAELKKKKEQEAAALKGSQHQEFEDSEDEDEQPQLQSIGLSQEAINKVKLEDIGTLFKVKTAFRTRFQNLMTNILKIALQKEDEKVACIITAYYEIALEEEMIVRAITNNNYQWLLFVWAFDKNYIGARNKDGALFMTFEQLFDLIKRQYPNEIDSTKEQDLVKEKVKKVIDWRIITNDNILIALLAHHFDELAIKSMGYYSHLLDKELFVFCMTHGNNFFLQRSLLLVAFDKMIFREDAVIHQILTILKEGYRTNFLMNILTLIDISVWKNKHLKELIEIINDYVEENYDKNRLLLSPNPLMSIALAAELLNKVGDSRRKFENECTKIRGQLLGLGKMFSSKISDEKYYEKLIMQEDFKSRTVLKIIIENNFESLMDEEDPKAENLMLMIWHGKEATRCDGNIYGYSNLAHIIMTKAKKISGKKTSLMQMITNYFEPNFKVDYSFQYRYRSKAISFYFKKEFLCALAMLVIFQYINYRYLVLFSTKYLQDNISSSNSTDSIADKEKANLQINTVIRSIRQYVDWNFWGLFFSAALIFQFILKLLFNMCSKTKIAMDKWTVMDTISAGLNILAVELIQNINPADLLIPHKKDMVDYFMIVVLCISWLRFFAYFLVVRTISKLLLTLLAMIGDTLSFMFIVSCFILIMSSIFTTLYQDVNPEKYGGLALTVRTLFDAALGQYDYDGMGTRDLSHSILMIFHVFFSNILLMNYLIAILSTTYDNMRETGIFKYKINLYQYCERFMIAFNNKSYGESILHPPPLSYLSVLMIPFFICTNLMVYISKGFSYLMYWLENLIFIFAFFALELLICPIAYIKVWFNLIRNSMGVFRIICNCIVWAIIGVIMMVFIVISDFCNLLKILCCHQGCRYGHVDELAEQEIDQMMKKKIYNETRTTVISLYKRLQKHMKQGGQDESMEDSDDDIEEDTDFFHIEDDENMNEDFLYVVKKSLIIDEWKKRKVQMARREKMRQKQIQDGNEGSELKSMLVNSLRKKLGKQVSNASGNKTHSKNESWSNSKKEKNKPVMAKDLNSQLKVVFLEALKKQAKKTDDDQDIDMSDFEISDEECKLVDEFLTKFTIVSESSMNEHLDIMLMLKALPNKVMDYTLTVTEQFNFRIFQESLIAFQNLDIVNAFEYFDDKNRERVQNVKDKLQNQKANLNDVKDILELVKIKIERNEEYFTKQKGGIPGMSGNDGAPKIDMQKVNLMGSINDSTLQQKGIDF